MRNQEEIEDYLNQMLDDTERDIDKVFANRLKALNDLLSRMFREYGENGSISRSKIYAYNRFEKEMELIKELIHEDYQELYKEINNLMKQQWLDNYLMSAYVYEMSQQLEMGYQIPSAETINQAIENPIKELRLPKLMQNHRNEIVRRIRIEIASGIQAGEDYSTIAKRLEDAVNFSRSKARRVARTESGRVQVTSRLESAEQAQRYAKLSKTWMATLDTHTRDTHRRLDGKEADDNGMFHIRGMVAPGPSLWVGPTAVRENVNCRCDVFYMVNNKRPEVRRYKDYGDAQYQKRLAERTDELMASEGITEKQARRKAKRQVFAPNKVIKYQTYDKWLADQPRE